MIAIIDYGMGNLASVKKAFDYIGCEAKITSDPDVVLSADGVILPGVGAVSFAMEALKAKGLDVAVKKVVENKTPLLGICLGMQMLFETSEEHAEGEADVKCLGVIPGKVRLFDVDKTVEAGLKVPKMGWNNLVDVKGKLLKEGEFVYFVHSYYCAPSDADDVAAYAEYGIKYACAVERENVFATQFHPEKSGEVGLQILTRFARLVESR